MDFTRLKDYMDRLVTEYNTPGVDCIVYREHKEDFQIFHRNERYRKEEKNVRKRIIPYFFYDEDAHLYLCPTAL